MAQSNNDSIIQQFLNTSTPVQEPDPSAYDFIGQSDTAVTTPPPTEDTIARARLAFAKDTSKRNIDTAKTVLQAKKALGIDPRVAMHEQYMQGIETRNEGLTTLQSNIHNNPGNVGKGQEYAGETGKTYANDRKIPFVDFDTPQMGVRAVFMDMRSKMGEFNGNLLNMISKYAPPDENNTQAYYENVKSRLNGKEIVDESDMADLVKAIIAQENTPETASYYLNDPTILDEAYALSKIQLPSGATYQEAKSQLDQQSVGFTPEQTEFTVPSPVEPQRSVGSTAVEDSSVQRLPKLKENQSPTPGPSAFKNGVKDLLKKMGLPSSSAELDTSINNFAEKYPDLITIDESVDSVDTAKQNEEAIKKFVAENPQWVSMEGVDPIVQEAEQVPEESIKTLSYQDALKKRLKEQDLQYGAKTSFRDRVLQTDTSPTFRQRILDIVKEPSIVSQSEVTNINGNVLSHGDGTYSAILDGKVISNFPTEEAAAFHAVSHAANKRILAGGGYEQWSFDDLKASLIGGAALVGEAGARLTMGDPTLNGKVREYNALKQSQKLLNDSKTDISDNDLKNYRAIRDKKVLTPELEAWKKEASTLMHYGVSKFDAMANLDKEAKDNVQLSKDIEEYGNKWRKLFPENDSGWQGSQAAIDLIAAKNGDWEGIWELVKNHKMAHVKKGVGSAAYSVAILSNSLTIGAPVLTAFVLDEIRRAKVEWIEKNGEEGFTEDIESNLEWFITAKVLSQKASLGYLDKTVGAVLPGRKAWMKKSIEYIDKVTPDSIKNLPMVVKKPIAVAATLGSGIAGEMVQGGLEPVLKAKAMGEEVKTLDIGKGAAAEGLGSVALAPTFAGARVAKGVYDVAKSPSVARAQTKKNLETKRDKLKADLKKIEDQEQSINPKDIANFESLQNDVKEIEEALAQLPNASIDRWGQDAEPKLTSNNKVINELFKTYGPLINDNTFSIQDALNEMQQQLEERLDGKSTELDAVEKRLPMPAGKEPTVKEKLSREYVSDLFSDKKKDTSIKVKDTQYGEQKKGELEKLEAEIKQIEESDAAEPSKIIALDIKTKELNKLSLQLEERASADLLKAEKQHIENQLAKNKEQLNSKYIAGKKGSTIQEVINTQISMTAGKDISDEEVAGAIKDIQDNIEYMPIDEETEYGKGDIVDLKNTDNEEVDSAQGYIIQEVLPQQEDGKVHVRLKGVDETVPVDQLIPRVRTNEDPRNTLEKLEALTQRNLSDASKKLVQAEFDRLVKEYGPKVQFKEGDLVNTVDGKGNLTTEKPARITKFLGKGPDGFDYVTLEGSDTGQRLDRLERVDSKGGKTFGSIDDSYEEHEKLSIDEANKKLKAAKSLTDATGEEAENVVYWENQVKRKQEQSRRATKEEQADKTMADVHSEILEGESKKWKGLAKYHEEIINAYKNLTDPVLRERNIRAITSKMKTHATNLQSKLAQFKRARGMIPNLAPGMGAVVVGSIDEKSPRGVRKMNYKVQTMPLTEADAKAQAKANGTEYKEGQSFESRKDNGQFVTLISNKTHKFKNFTIRKSSGLIRNLEAEVGYGKLIMGSVEGYAKTSMAQKAANQEIKIEARKKVYDQLVELRGKLPRVIQEISEEDREKIKVDEEKKSKPLSLEKQLEEVEKKLEATEIALKETEDTDENKATLGEALEKLKTEQAGLKARIAEESTQDKDETEGDDATGEDQTSKKSTPPSDESASDVRKSSEPETGQKGEQFEFRFTGKNFLETATRLYNSVLGGKIETALGLIGKKFTELVSVGKKTTILGLQNLADTDFADAKALAKALEGLGIESKSAKILADRYSKFKTRFDKTLFHPISLNRSVVLLARDGNSKEELAAAGETFTVLEIDGANKTVTIQNQNVTGDDTWTVPLNDVVDAENYAIRQPLSLLYREDDKNADNQQGTLPEQVIFSMMIGAMTWRQRTSDNNRFAENDFAMEAFLYNNQQSLDDDEKAELRKIGYGYNDVARQIGNEITQMLHLSPKRASGELTQEGIDIYFEHLIPALGMAAIETAQGSDSEAYFIKDLHEWKFEEADRSDEGRVYNNNPTGSPAAKAKFGYRHLKVDEDNPPAEEAYAAVKNLTETLELNIQSNAGPLQNPQDIKTDVSGTFGDVPLEVQRLLKKLHKVEWSKSEPMDIVSDLFEDHHEVLKEILGIEELYKTNAAGDFVYEIEDGDTQQIKEKLQKFQQQYKNVEESGSRRKVAAQTNYQKNTILIDRPEAKETFKKKEWTKPKVEGVKALKPDAFKNFLEWEKFLIAHERAHFTPYNRGLPDGAEKENNANDQAYAAVQAFRKNPNKHIPLLAENHEIEVEYKIGIYSNKGVNSPEVEAQLKDIQEKINELKAEEAAILSGKGKTKLDKNGEPVKIPLWHKRDMESKEAANRDKLLSLERLVKANDKNELEKFYFTYNLQNHHRIMQEGKINPQQSKVDRFLVRSFEPKTYTDRNMWKFELAVAQNFGTKIDKETYGFSKEAFNDLVDDPIVLKAVSAYQKLTKARALVESTKLNKANKTKHKNAVAAKKAAAKEFAEALSAVKFTYKKGNMSLLQGIAGLANYMVVTPVKSARLGYRKTLNTTFKSDIVMEIDGISNGFAMNVMQFPMWENMPEMLAKVATYFGEDTEHNLEAPDTYETLAEYVQKGMGDGTMTMNETNMIPYQYTVDNNWKDTYDKLSIYKKRKNKYKVYEDESAARVTEQIIQRDDDIDKKRKVKAFARKQYYDRNKPIPEWTKKDSKTNKVMSADEIKAEDEFYANELAVETNVFAATFNDMPPGPERTKAFAELNKARKAAGLDPVKPLKGGPKRRTKAQEDAFNKTLDQEEKERARKQNIANNNFLEDYNRINGALNTVYPDFTGEVGEELRSVVKYPFIIHMYGGGIERISKDVTKDIISHLYSQIGILTKEYNDAVKAAPETKAFFEQYKGALPLDTYENIETGLANINSIVKKIEDFSNALAALGAFNQDNRNMNKARPPQSAEAFTKLMVEGKAFNVNLNEAYLRANISTTIAPRFEYGLKTMLEPTQEARDTIVQMGGVLHGIFAAHFTQAYDKKVAELNDGRTTLTRRELTELIKDTKGELIKVFPKYAGPLSSLDENGNIEGFVDLSKTKSVSTTKEKVGVPKDIDKKDIWTAEKLTKFIEDNADDFNNNARERLAAIIDFRKDIPAETKEYLAPLIKARHLLADERVEYRTAKQNEDGTYDQQTSTTHNTFPQQLKFIEPGVSALIRQIINMDSVLLTQTMNGDPNVKVGGQRWVGDPNVLMLHDAFMASPEQLSDISEAYGQLFLHYNRTHSVIEKTYDQVKKALAITKSMDEAAPEGTPSLLGKFERWLSDEFFDNKNKKEEDKIELPALLKMFEDVLSSVANKRVELEELASENGTLSESRQMFMQRPKQSQGDMLRDVLYDIANETAANRPRNTVPKSKTQTDFTKSFEDNDTLTQLDFNFSEEEINDLKNSLMSEKGEVSETENLNDITRNTVQTLFGDFTKLSGNYYNTAEEASQHTDTLSRVIGILSEGFDSTAGIQLTYEQIQGITQGSYSQAFERMTVSKSQRAPTTRNGQSPQEVYAHELLHAMTGIGLDQSPLVRQRIETLYNNVLDTLGRTYGRGQEYKVFLPSSTGPTNLATSAEILMARELFKHAFHAKESHRLHEFMAFANTNASLSNFMKQNPLAQRTDLYGRMLNAIKYIVDMIKQVLNQKVYNPTDSSQVAEAVAITEQLVAAQNKYKSKGDQIRSKTYKALDASDQIIRKFANNAFKAYQKAAWKHTQQGGGIRTANIPLQVATGLVALPYIYFGEEDAVNEIRNSTMEKLNYSLRGVLKEFGDGVLSPALIEQLLQSKVNISKQRQLAETFQIDWFNGNKDNGVTSIWQSLDPTKPHAMSIETREALTNVMLRTDISQLITAGLDLNSPAGMKKIISLIGKDATASQERGLLKKQILKRLNIKGDHPAAQYASELAHWMMTGNTERLSNARQNAYSIALDYLPNPTEERVGLLDAFATIEALGEIESRDASLIGQLANKEFAANPNENAFISIMQSHVYYKAKSRKDLFDGDPTQMMKGYIVERMDNLTDIKIGTPEQKDEMYENGYTYDVPLTKIAPGQTHYIMYVNRNKPEIKDVSGIMSTTNQRNQGTTLTEILSLNPDFKDTATGKPDMFRIRAEIKKFKNHQDKLAKRMGFDSRFKLRPVFDERNVISDYRIMMNHKDTKEILKPDLEFQNVFAHMHSNLVDRKNTIKNDKETIHLLVHEQENLYKEYPNQFINILDPESPFFERYLKMPRPIRDYMQEFAENGKFMVRIDIVDKVFGYKQKDITQAKMFEDNNHPLLKQAAGLAHYAVKETVSYGKNRVVLAVPKVIIGNMLSNIFQLLMRKISPGYIMHKLIEGLSEYKRYSKDVLEMKKLQYKIDTKKLDPVNSIEAKNIARLKVRIEGNKIHAMNEAGVDSLIIEDLNEAQLDGYFNRMSRVLFKGDLSFIGDRIPRSVQTVAHTLFWTKESLPYKYSKQVVQMTDFMGRYVMMEHDQNVLGHSFKKSLHNSLEAFVLFDESLIAPLEMLDAVGATAFLSYWLRNQRAVKKLVQANPSSVAISAVVQEMTGIPTLGNINSAWMGGDFIPNIAQADDMWDEANNVTLFEALAQIKGGF